MRKYKIDFTNTIRILFLFFGITIGILGCNAVSIKMDYEITKPIRILVIKEEIPDIPFYYPTSLHPFSLQEDSVESDQESKQLTGKELYDTYVYKICEKYPNVNPETIRAIIYVESRYVPDVTSQSKCVGLMQVSLKWHTDRARSLGVEDLYDPYGNILTGVDVFNDFLTNYANGDEVYAIMMYNMGQSRAKILYQKGVISSYALDVLEQREIQKEDDYA